MAQKVMLGHTLMISSYEHGSCGLKGKLRATWGVKLRGVPGLECMRGFPQAAARVQLATFSALGT